MLHSQYFTESFFSLYFHLDFILFIFNEFRMLFIIHNTPLHYSVESGDLDIVKTLISNGANINHTDSVYSNIIFFMMVFLLFSNL